MRVARDLFAFLARLGIGVVFLAHGLQKFAQWGIGGTTQSFGKMGIPFPTVSTWYAALVEVLGGIALIIGFLLPLAGVLLAIDMAGALFLVHLPNGLFVNNGGYEFVLVLGVASLALGFGGGRWALDHALFRRVASRHRAPGTS